MAVDANSAFLFESLKLDDPIWLPPKPWESIHSRTPHSHSTASSSSSFSQKGFYGAYSVSEESVVRLAMNAMYGVQSALVSIEKLAEAFCSEPADRTFHRISSLWNRSLSTQALGKLLKSIGCSGSIVFLLREFVDYFMNSNLDGYAFRDALKNPKEADYQNSHDPELGGAGSPPYSLVNQAFAVAVGKVLEGYICALDTLYASVDLRHSSKVADVSSHVSNGVGCLTSILQSEITLLEVYLHTKELRTQIQAIGNICNLHHVALCFSVSSVEDLIAKANLEFRNFPRGGDLLSYLYSQLQVADLPHRAVLKFLFLRSFEPYCGFIRSWIYKAEISDPYKEFIIEYVNNLPSYSHGKAGISVDFPLAVIRERQGVALPCFLNDFLVPLLRAGQQLQVLMKLLELCNYVGAHTFKDIFPCWSGFSSSHPYFASPLNFNKGKIEALVVERSCYYEKMWQKLENILKKLEFRHQQVVPLGIVPVFVDNARDKKVLVSSNLDDGLVLSSPLAHKIDSISAVGILGSEVSCTADEFSDVVDPLESSECSSSFSSEEHDESEQLIELPNNLVGIEKKYFSALIFSDNSLHTSPQSAKLHNIEKNLGENSESTDFPGHFVQFHPMETSLSHIPIPLESGKMNWSGNTDLQKDPFHVGGLPDVDWTLGGLLKSPFHVDNKYGDDTMLHPSDCMKKVRDRNMGALKDSVSSFSKMMACENIFKAEGTNKDELENGTHNTFMLLSQRLKFHQNSLSMNPMLTKGALFHLPSHRGDRCLTDLRESFSCFDFSSVENPCKLYVEKSVANSSNLFGDMFPSFAVSRVSSSTNGTSDFPARRDYCGDNLLTDKAIVPDVNSCVDLRDHSSKNVILPNVSEKTSWESLLASSSNAVSHSVGDHWQSLVAMFEIPLDFIIDKCLQQELLLQYKYVSKLTIKFLEEGFGLQEHLLALRRYHLMELADWADLFISSLWHHKWRVLETDGILSEIQGFLELSVQRSSCRSDNNKDRLYVYNKGHCTMPFSNSAIGVHSFDFVGLGYRVDWPLSIVLTPGALKIYADLFSFLMQLKLAVFSLTEVWGSLKDLMHLLSRKRHFDQCEREVRHFNLLTKIRHQVNHFVSMLQQYVQSQLSHVSWCRFLHSLKHKVNDMMDLELVHMAYLTDAINICFLSDETQSVARIVKTILQCALDFRSCLLGGTWEDGIDQGCFFGIHFQINISQVLAIQATFNKNLKELHLCYLKSPKQGEFGLSRFWGYLNYNEYYSGIIGNEVGHYALSL